MKETSQIFSLYTQIWAYFRCIFSRDTWHTNDSVFFTFAKYYYTTYLFIETNCFCKMAKDRLSYILRVHENVVLLLYVFSLNVLFYANFQKIVIKTYHKWASLLIYLVFIYI